MSVDVTKQPHFVFGRPGRATALRCSRRRDSIRDQRQDPLPLLQGAALAALVGLGRRVPQSPPPVALRSPRARFLTKRATMSSWAPTVHG